MTNPLPPGTVKSKRVAPYYFDSTCAEALCRGRISKARGNAKAKSHQGVIFKGRTECCVKSIVHASGKYNRREAGKGSSCQLSGFSYQPLAGREAMDSRFRGKDEPELMQVGLILDSRAEG